MSTKRSYGWRPDVPDCRDHIYLSSLGLAAADVLPPMMDLSGGFPLPPFDQGELGSCTANAAAGAIVFDQQRQGLPPVMPSRLYIYYNERVIEGTVSQDAGATIRDSVKSINTFGACPETEWPYNIKRFARKPSPQTYTDGKKCKAVKYARVTRALDAMRQCLAGGIPFLIGISVYESFESDAVAKTGVVPLPEKDETLLGGHAVVCCGYDTAERTFRCRNSWGTDWGVTGYFTLPFEYLLDPNLSDDFWVVQSVA